MLPDRWLELSVEWPGDDGLVTAVLLDLGASAVEEGAGAFLSYYPPPLNVQEFLATARKRLEEVAGGAPFDVHWRWQAQEDWEVLWRRGLGPRRITPRLMVVPSWEEYHPKPDEIVIVLDPGMAFGTAEHATTRGCLRILDEIVEPGSRVADVGAGSGILSIAAARMGAVEVLAIEMDEMSCETALENISRNGVADRVEVLAARLEGDGELPKAPYRGIVANMQSHILHPLLPLFSRSIEAGGWLVVSGILAGEEREMVAAASGHGFTLLTEDREDQWWTGSFSLFSSSS